MKRIFAAIHLVIISCVVLTGNDIYDKVLGGIISVMSYIYAFRLTGKSAYRLGFNPILMSTTYWIIKTVIDFFIIISTRAIYLNMIERNISSTGAFIILTVFLIIIAEILKSSTGLKKKYW